MLHNERKREREVVEEVQGWFEWKSFKNYFLDLGLTLEALDPVVIIETFEAVDLFKLLLKLRLLLRAGVGGPGLE